MKAMTTQIFEQNGVDIVLNGHNHYYEHNLVNGIHHMILGTFGVEPQTPFVAPYTVYSEMTRNFGIIETTSSSLTLTTYRENGTVIETIVLTIPVIPGDVTGDGTVDGLDYAEVVSYWGTGVPPEPIGTPEPAALLVLIPAALAALFRRPKK